VGKSDKENAELFTEHLSEVFCPHTYQGHEVEQVLAAPIQSQERLKASTLKEIKDEIKVLNQIKGTRSRPYYCQNSKRTTKRRTCKHNIYIQRHTAT
jgi:hypothetical protein